MKDFVISGKRLCSYEDGIVVKGGAYREGEFLYASIPGVLVIKQIKKEGSENVKEVEVETEKSGDFVPYVGALVTAKITKMTQRYCKCRILIINSTVARDGFNGVLRKEDVRAKEKHKVELAKCFKPGDVILATVISTNDPFSYILSTADNNLGVVFAKSEADALMVPVSWSEMRCCKTYMKESRKVAKIQSRHVIP